MRINARHAIGDGVVSNGFGDDYGGKILIAPIVVVSDIIILIRYTYSIRFTTCDFVVQIA